MRIVAVGLGALFVLPLVLLWCADAPSETEVAATLEAAAPSAVPVVQAAQPERAPPPPLRPAQPKTRLLDTRDWAKAPAGSTIEITWTVRRDRLKLPKGAPEFSPDLIEVPVELTMTLAGRSHSFSVTGNAAGPFAGTCEPDHTTLPFFYAGGSLNFWIERVTGNRAVITRLDATGDSVDSEPGELSDQAVFDVPRDVHFQQRIVVIGDDHSRTELCGPSHDPG